jgi:iron complex outermembrane receptor protein
MITSRPARPARPSSLLLSGLLSAIFPAAFFGQTVAPIRSSSSETRETVQLEAFTVTGSNIRRTDIESALPVTIIDREDMDMRGASTPAELSTP